MKNTEREPPPPQADPQRSAPPERPIPWWAWLIALWLVLALIRKLLT